jgi:hypothetical protein
MIRENSAVKLPIALFVTLASATPAFAVDPTGIPICDNLLERYEKCTIELPPARVHAAQKELLEGAMSLRANASNPELRPTLEKFCADTFDAMKSGSDLEACMSK